MSTQGLSEFFERLPAVQDFQQLFDRTRFEAVPAEWFIILTDLRGSTKAIGEGKYKEVNLVGAATIMAVLNACKGVSIPYVFGGDGATLLIPPNCLGPAREALSGSIVMARESFGFQLRAGIVPIKDLLKEGVSVHLAKWALSPHLVQAIFRGGGLALAESWIKDPSKRGNYCIEPDGEPKADFTGLECRWNSVPAQQGEAASVLVKALGPLAEQEKTYIDVIRRVDEIYDQQRPFHSKDLSLAFGKKLSGEAKVRSYGRGVFGRALYRTWLSIQVLCGFYLVSSWGPKKWKQYRKDVVGNTDSRKFDDMFRTVLEGTPARHAELRAYLEEKRIRGELVFGIHKSTEMLLTCLVFNRTGGHLHFIDGNDGGYALAAVELKKQLQALTPHP